MYRLEAKSFRANPRDSAREHTFSIYLNWLSADEFFDYGGKFRTIERRVLSPWRYVNLTAKNVYLAVKTANVSRVNGARQNELRRTAENGKAVQYFFYILDSIINTAPDLDKLEAALMRPIRS